MTELSRFRFFLPYAKALTQDEIAQLPSWKIKAAEVTGEPGIWLEIEGMNKSWLDEDGNITIPARGTKHKEKGTFLNLFCPEGSCEIVEGSDLP
jgi:hypothetical protein